MTTITVTIDDEERGSTIVTREVELGRKTEGVTEGARDAAERRMHQQVGMANRLTDISREVAVVAASLHLI